ncbi:His/Gly/Thr/Pro-type tRNA ligase C-terminal domain-containing protein [Halorubellus sp. PRR65]|uniref:His/Gly/Thr/Pro-type tRNA ligase C-terminal domain-containing protein n=1 Tax=Halorubellus sp. PRR65 TaxID=3098148 RepID=UPI002B259B5F|nr:His/Gly/Thr/Pro-type tRNA ligase C-terminal domain-containing protein [Halorubellus sp. PRR65]
MRLLFVHVDAVSLSRGDRALDRDDADERAATTASEAAVASASFEDALVAFATVESGDGTAPGAVRAAGARAVREAAADLRVDDVVLVPSALLSARAASPTAAAGVWDGFPAAVATDDGSFDGVEAGTGPAAGFATTAAGFGWRYAVDVEAKAHPFATAACTVDPATSAAEAGRDGATVEGQDRSTTEGDWVVVTPDGGREPADAFVDDRARGSGVVRAVRAVVPSLPAPPRTTRSPSGAAPPDRGDRARALGVADRDPLDPAARLRPAGASVRDRLADAVAGLVAERAPSPQRVAGPRALDLDDDAVRAYAATLDAGGHGVALADRRVLPDALGAGTALATLADAGVDATDAPLAVFDADAPAPAATGTWDGSSGTRDALSAGSCAPAVHEVHATDAAARDAVADHAALAHSLAEDCALDPLPVVTTTPGFDDANEWAGALAARVDAPVLVNVDETGPAAWPLRVAVAVATPEGDALRTGVVRLDDDGLRHFAPDVDPVPSVVHAAPAGALDATVAAICDAGASTTTEGAPTPEGDASAPTLDEDASTSTPLPDWLAPTQVRLVPVADDHVERAAAIAAALADAGVRVDVDDRARSVGARIERAERERVPRYVVVGDDESPDGALPVTDVATGRERDRDVDALAATVADAVAEATVGRTTGTRPAAAPRRLSARLAFDDAK